MLPSEDVLASAFQSMQVSVYHGFLLGALLPKRHISRLERGCPDASMLAPSSSDISLVMINVRSMQRRSQHGAKDGCACICFGHLVGEYVSWGDASQAPHQPFGATLPKHQNVCV